MNKLQGIIEKYVDAVIAHGRESWGGDYKIANKYFKVYTKCYAEICKYGKEGEEALKALLNHDSPFVRCSAAYHILPFDSDAGVKVLKKCKSEPGGVGLNAKTTISEWNSGSLRFPIDKEGKIIYVTADELSATLSLL